jgi:hypothetical protein
MVKGKGHPITGHRGPQRAPKKCRGIVLLMLDLGARRGWVVSTTPRPLYPGKDPVPIVQEAGWTPEPVRTCAKNLPPPGTRSPDRPARSQSLYRMSYPAHILSMVQVIKNSKCSTNLQEQNRSASSGWNNKSFTAVPNRQHYSQSLKYITVYE